MQEVTAKSVTAERFRLVDSDGELRAVMKTKQDEPVVQFMDDEHRVRFEIKLENDWPVMSLMNDDSKTQIEFGLAGGKPALFFKDSTGSLRLGIALSKPDGSPRLLILDQDEKPRFAILQDDTGTPQISALDDNGNRYKLVWFAAHQKADPETEIT
jgi:hypothetical protein